MQAVTYCRVIKRARGVSVLHVLNSVAESAAWRDKNSLNALESCDDGNVRWSPCIPRSSADGATAALKRDAPIQAGRRRWRLKRDRGQRSIYVRFSKEHKVCVQRALPIR